MPPLAGVRVVEVANFLAGPFCATQLADLGAEVTKIEPPGTGDQERVSAPLIDGESSGFVRVNRGKRSLSVDLKRAQGKAILRRLLQTADILVENLRPGAMRRLGFGYDEVTQLRPELIYVSASGWGQDGPLSELPGLDIMAQARGGLMSITGQPSGEPSKVGVPVCDLVCGLYGALAAVAALAWRQRTGIGQHIDVNLLESGVSLAVWEAARYFATGEIPTAQGSAHPLSAPYQAVRASDGYLTVGAVTPKAWAALCAVLEAPHLLDDPRYADKNTRRRNRDSLIPTIESITMTRPVAHWISLLEAAEVPCAPVNDFGQVFEDEHLNKRQFFWDAEHSTLGLVRQLGSPMRFSGTPANRGTAGPLLGEHSTRILEEIGYSTTEIQDFITTGAVFQHPVTAHQPTLS